MTESNGPTDLNERIVTLATSMGITKVGFAVLNDITIQPELRAITGDMRYAVSMLQPLNAPVSPTARSKDLYHTAMVQARADMDLAATDVASLIRSTGHNAIAITSAFKVHPKLIRGQVSHRLVAHHAGLGWIGRSTLLVTPEYGPRVRLITVLTDAPVASINAPMENRCGQCRVCIDNCPMKALTYNDFKDVPNERSDCIDFAKCDRYEKATLSQEPPSFCARCVRLCPVGMEK